MIDALSALGSGFPAVAPDPLGSEDLDEIAAQGRDLEEAPTGPDMEQAQLLIAWIDNPNIALELTDAERGEIAQRVQQDYEIDDDSRAEWRDNCRKWLDVAEQVVEHKTYPWPGASNVVYPLVAGAAIQFAARAYPGIVRDRDVVRGTVVGDDDGVPAPDPRTGQPATGPDGKPVWIVQPGAKRTRADRIGKHMSWQLLTEMEDWEEQTDELLLKLAIVGTMFRKTYFDPGLQRNVSETIDPLRVVINYKAKSFARAPRITEEIELYPWEIEERIRAGLFLDENYGQDHDMSQDEDAPVTFLEQHRRWDLDGDGYAEPYIVTIARDSGTLARIVAGYDADGVMFDPVTHKVRKVTPVKFFTRYAFMPSLQSPIYAMGFGALLYPINAAINTSLNQLFDAGHLANAGGGFIGSSVSMNTGSVRFQVGEFKIVNTNGATLRENLVPLPFQGPNAILFQLLQFLVEAGREIASIKDILTGEMPGANVPGILGLAVIQQGMKVFSAIFKRIHRALADEYDILFRLNRLYLDDETGFRVGEQYFRVTRADYEQASGVQPVSDPEAVTDQQQMARANFLLTFKDDPWFDGKEVRRRALEAGGIADMDKLLRDAPPQNPDVMFKVAELQMDEKHKGRELDMREGHMRAQEIASLANAYLHLANARKASAGVDQSWFDLKLRSFKDAIDTLSPPDSSAGGTPVPTGGPVGGGVQGVAPSPGVPGGAGIPGGLPGQPGGNAP